MAFPYISGAGNIATMIARLRKSFPKTVTADTVKQLGIASNNESYVINTLGFIGLLDSDGNKTDRAQQVFSNHKDEAFEKAFAEMVKDAYAPLFDLHGDDAWNLDSDDLITFFRTSDQTSDPIGRRQSGVFKVLAALSGHGEVPEAKTKSAKQKSPKPPVNKAIVKVDKNSVGSSIDQNTTKIEKDIGLTVRVEINLPAGGDKETYDNIFKSIRENLID